MQSESHPEKPAFENIFQYGIRNTGITNRKINPATIRMIVVGSMTDTRPFIFWLKYMDRVKSANEFLGENQFAHEKAPSSKPLRPAMLPSPVLLCSSGAFRVSSKALQDNDKLRAGARKFQC